MRSLLLMLLLLQVPELAPPSRVAPPMTPAESAAIKEGIALHEQGRYDDAIERYNEALKLNPDNVIAIYETAYSYSRKGDAKKTIEVAARGTQYQSPVLAPLYVMIGSALESTGDPQGAIDVFKKGLEVAPAAGTLHHSLAVTYSTALKDRSAAKSALKQGAFADPNHPGIQIFLARTFAQEDLKTPALLAATRFLVLEPGSARTQDGYTIWRVMLNGNTVQPSAEGGPVQISVRPDQSKEEGDLSTLDLDISMSRALAIKTADGKSEIESMVWQVDSLFAMYAKRGPGEDKATFLWTYYMPYITEMQQKGFVEPFVYFANQRTNLPGVREWLTANRDRVNAFLSWSRDYKWPGAVVAAPDTTPK